MLLILGSAGSKKMQAYFALMMSAEVIHLVSRELTVADSLGQGIAVAGGKND